MIQSGQAGEDGVARRACDALWRWKLAILATGVLFALSAFLATQAVDPIYRAEASVRLGAGDGGARSPASAREKVLRIVRSPLFVQATLGRLDPAASDPAGSSLVERWVRGRDDPRTQAPPDRTAWLLDGLSVAEGPVADVVTIGFQSPDPEQASAVANAVATELSTSRAEGSTLAAAAEPPAAAGELRRNIELALESLSASEERLGELERARTASPPTGPAAGSGPLEAEAERVANEIGRLGGEIRDLDRLAEEGGAAPASLADERPELADLVQRRRRLGTAVDALAQTLPATHPRVEIGRLRLADHDGDIGAAARRLREPLASELSALRQREADLARERERLAQQEADAAIAQEQREEEWNALQEQLAEERETLDAYRRRYEAVQASLSDAPAPAIASEPVATILAPAEVPSRPSFPEVLPITVLAGLFGMALATIGVLVSPLAAGSGRGAAPRTGRTRDMALPIAPLRRTAADTPPVDASSPFRRNGPEVIGLDDVAAVLASSDVSRILIASPAAPDGRRTAIDLARRLALRSYSVVLVDLTGEQSAARSMGVPERTPGIDGLATGSASYAEIVKRDVATTADVVGVSGEGWPAAEPGGEPLRRALDFVARTYECVLVDCGGLPAAVLKALMDEDAALVLAADDASPQGIEALTGELAAAGLGDFLLVSGARSLAPSRL